jgi:hypothetical protein
VDPGAERPRPLALIFCSRYARFMFVISLKSEQDHEL